MNKYSSLFIKKKMNFNLKVKAHVLILTFIVCDFTVNDCERLIKG